jgi:hypothetical protein
LTCRLPCGDPAHRSSDLATPVHTQAPAWQVIGRAMVDLEGWDHVRFLLTWPAGGGFGLDWQLCAEGEDGDTAPLVAGAGDVTGAAAPLASYVGTAVLRARIPAAAPPSPIPLRWSYRRHAAWRGCGEV